MANKINVLECGPRDGWQNLKQMLTFDQKMDLIDRMFDAGVTQMEVTSFVSPKAIPQMADAADVAKACIEKHPDATLYALVPNFRGVENAFNAGIRSVSYVISVSESHNKANIRRTHEESLAELQKIMDTYPQMNICVALATVFGCPFEGIPPIQKPVDFAKRVYDMGIRSICLADTIGIADPHQVRETIQAMVETMPDCEFQIHIHDTRGMGLANTLAAIECGITTVQSTLGGLGGCPLAPGGCVIDTSSMSAYLAPQFVMPKGAYKLARTDREKFIKKLVARAGIAPKDARPGLAYAISKHFVIWFAKTDAARFGEKNVRCLSVTPGNFDTPMGALESGQADVFKKYSALKRNGKPEEIAALFALLLDERLGFLTGADILMDGGVVASGASGLSK